MVNVYALIAIGVNAEGYREILGVDVTTAEDGAGLADVFALTDRPRPGRGATSSPETPTPAFSRRSARLCPARPGSDAVPITRPT